MYDKIEYGELIDIQGLPCIIPPVGYVLNIVTKKLEYIGVYERSSIKEEQYWERIPLPDWYGDTMKKWDAYEKKKKEEDIEFYDDRLEDYKKQQWSFRMNGFWFKNNGKDTYLTGSHYLYMQWFSIDIGYPRFRIPDLEYFYFLQYCIEDPNCMGALEITKRRFGKTFRGGLFVIDYVTRTKMTQGTLQSKTGADAKKVFSKAIVNPFRRLPRFFRPEYDMSLGVNPKTEMRFEKTNVRGRNANENIDKDELGSSITWYSADPLAQDGQKVHRSFQDEFAKTTECDIYDRHEVMRYCVVDDEGNIVGKLLYSSTVEKLDSEKTGVQDGAKKLWDDSNHLNKGENGRTPSGLYRFFMTAKRAKNFNIYGVPDEEKTVKEILADRETVKNNLRSLSARIRKEPITIDEAFSVDSEGCIFNSFNISDRKKHLSDEPVYKRSVWFYRDINTQQVIYREPSDKEKEFHWKITQFPANGQSNKVIFDSNIRKPGRISDGCIGIDGYSNNQGGEKYGSKASAWIGRRYDINDPQNTGKLIGWLYGRPNDKDDLYDQCLLAAEFFGYVCYFEHVADDYFNYFRNRGRINYLGLYPLLSLPPEKKEDIVRHRGFPTTPFAITKCNDTGVSYVEKYCHLIDWIELLEDMEKYDPNNRTKSDITVSALITFVGLIEPIPIPKKRTEPLISVYGNPVLSHN